MVWITLQLFSYLLLSRNYYKEDSRASMEVYERSYNNALMINRTMLYMFSRNRLYLQHIYHSLADDPGFVPWRDRNAKLLCCFLANVFYFHIFSLALVLFVLTAFDAGERSGLSYAETKKRNKASSYCTLFIPCMLVKSETGQFSRNLHRFTPTWVK